MSERIDVLVVDDSPTVARSVDRQLRGSCEVRLAGCVSDALALMDDHAPDVVLCDYQLGDDSGVELLEKVAQRHPDVRRVLYSGYELDQWRPLVDDGTVHAVLSKPWNLGDLFVALGLPIPGTIPPL